MLTGQHIKIREVVQALREDLEAEVKASAVVRQQRDAVRHESNLREAEIAQLRQELEQYQAQNLSLKTSQDDLEVPLLCL